MDAPLRFVIIGCGRIAERHAAIISQHGRLVGVCDIDHDKANSLAIQYSAEVFYDADEMLERLHGQMDVVVVCSPNGLHVAHSIAAMQHGAHVLCEKPMAIRFSDAKKMMEVANVHGRHLAVVKQNRFNPPVVAVKGLIDAGKLGKIISVQCNGFWNRPPEYYAQSWRGTLELDGGTLYTQFSHFVDLLIWFFGPFQPICAVAANGMHKGSIAFEDVGMVQGRFQSGALLNMHYTVNAWEKNMEGSITIFGEKGTLKIGGQYLNTLEYECLEGHPIGQLPVGNPPNEYGTYVGSMSNHPQVYEAFLRQLEMEPQVTTALKEAAATVEVIEQIYKLATIT